ncbi:MAG TPA: NUDIX domain-containing protein [Candidatus Paceibacterota bacterium]
MPTSLTIAEQTELTRLLGIVANKDGGFIPDPAYRPMHKLVPWPAVEVLIHNENGRFVLTYRDDEFKGWHIPGGYMKPNESYQGACNRHVRKEKIAEAVTNLQLIATHVWRAGEHPYSYPISLIIACKAVGEVAERDDLKWFEEIPQDIIPQQHPEFLAHFQKWFKGDQESAAIL